MTSTFHPGQRIEHVTYCGRSYRIDVGDARQCIVADLLMQAEKGRLELARLYRRLALDATRAAAEIEQGETDPMSGRWTEDATDIPRAAATYAATAAVAMRWVEALSMASTAVA